MGRDRDGDSDRVIERFKEVYMASGCLKSIEGSIKETERERERYSKRFIWHLAAQRV